MHLKVHFNDGDKTKVVRPCKLWRKPEFSQPLNLLCLESYQKVVERIRGKELKTKYEILGGS